MKRIKVKADQCAGCRQCEMVCSFEHFNRFSLALSRVTVHKDDRYGLDYPVMCRQCTDCPPIDACPVQALSRTEEGLTWCSWQDCTGCGICEYACTYGTIKLADGKPLICDQCGGDPQCVARCPTDALEYIVTPPSIETPSAAFSRLKEEWDFE